MVDSTDAAVNYVGYWLGYSQLPGALECSWTFLDSVIVVLFSGCVWDICSLKDIFGAILVIFRFSFTPVVDFTCFRNHWQTQLTFESRFFFCGAELI